MSESDPDSRDPIPSLVLSQAESSNIRELRKPNFWIALGFYLLLLLFSVFLFYRVNGFLGGMEARLVTDRGGQARLSAMGHQVSALRDALTGALADSVEIRLRTLEKKIASGQVGKDEIQLLKELQDDLGTLEGATRNAGYDALDESGREHARYRAALAGTQTPMGNQLLLQEIARIRNLFYLCLTGLVAGAGFMTVRTLCTRVRLLPSQSATSPSKQIPHRID